MFSKTSSSLAFASALAALSILTAPVQADTIYMTDGTSIEDVTVQSEGLDFVTYKVGSKTQTAMSDGVLFVEFSSKPQDVDQADAAIGDELLMDALDGLESFLAGMTEPPRRKPWSFAYALYRLVQVHEIMGELDKVIATVDHLIAVQPDSRYAPLAQMRKIQAISDSDKSPASAIEDLRKMIDAKQLGNRWRIEADLASVIFDATLNPKDKIKQLEDLSARAGVSFPLARNRAEVALGEEALRGNKVPAALKIFQGVAADPRADSRTLAAAYLGLGDCYWLRGERNPGEESGKADLNKALVSYMRIVVVYKAEQRYVAKAMFYAGRCFQLLDGEGAQEHASKLYKKLIRYYGGTRWAQEARGFRQK
jgi:tetratricopeptide (TPR) repeat protein